MDNTLKNILLAGIGSMAYTYEKASSMIETLVQKGEITVNQGKQLNEELKKVIDNSNQNTTNIDTETLKNIIQQLNLPTKKDIEDLKTRIDNLEKNN
ncbi:MAG: phasin family protein [Clostridiaceae bacterium]|nr:phasin family protein [Clostridiaceae bacterium]MBW4860156.1 phasin family protein [Clostridiaceae bacterium]MBW4869133.1 phasin family protein [Clostridiaceae bacterium]